MKMRRSSEGLDSQLMFLKGLVAEIECCTAAERRCTPHFDETMTDLEYRLRKLRLRNYFL